MRTTESRIKDVRNVVRAARSLVDRRASLIPLLVESTGLSSAGVELALTKHLETQPTDEELALLIKGVTDTPRVVVILSSNVFVGALRAIALARAAADEVIVRPSRRDPAFARALVEETRDPAIRVDDAIDVATLEDGFGEVHVYGHDETIADIRSKAREGLIVRGHGSGMGIAWVSKNAPIDASARGLADDIAFVEGDGARADEFAEALHAHLERFDLSVPRGQMPAEERAAGDRYVATMTYACRALVGNGHAIGIAPPGAPMVAAPAYRHVHVAACEVMDRARDLIEPMRAAIVAVGSDDVAAAKFLAPEHARLSALGAMQRPPLDGPVDRRPG
jgi:hypothetical protein